MTLTYQWRIDDDTSSAASLVSSSTKVYTIYEAIHSLARVVTKVWVLAVVAVPFLILLVLLSFFVFWVIYVKSRYHSWLLKRAIKKSNLVVSLKNIDKFYKLRAQVKTAADTLQKTIDSIEGEPPIFAFLGNPLVDTHSVVNRVYEVLNDKLSDLDNAPKSRFFKLQSHETLRNNRTDAYKYLV